MTAIELLSLANKTPGVHMRDLYLKRQRNVLSRKLNLVEIDLLRGGRHTSIAPQQLLNRLAGRFDYHVCIHRMDDPGRLVFHPLQLQQRLPTIGIPLLPGVADVPLDLQEVFNRSFDRGYFRRDISYEPKKLGPAANARTGGMGENTSRAAALDSLRRAPVVAVLAADQGVGLVVADDLLGLADRT